MTVIALGSVKASPGVTTAMLALAAVWPEQRPLLLIEADPDGGDLAARYGLRIEPGLTSLAAAGRRALASGEAAKHMQLLSGGLQVVVGPPDAEQATRSLEVLGERLVAALAEFTDRDVLIDCGRLRPGSPATALFAHADAPILVARPRLDELQHLHPRIERLTTERRRPGLLLIGDHPYSADEVARAVGVAVIGVLPTDPPNSDALNGLAHSRGRLQRSPLLRHARGIAEALVAKLTRVDGATRERTVSETAPPSGSSDRREDLVSHNGHGESSGWADALQRTSPTPPTGAGR